MPLTEKGKEVLASMRKSYGPESGERVFYAMKNKGTLTGVDSEDPSGGSWPAIPLKDEPRNTLKNRSDIFNQVKEYRDSATPGTPGTPEDQVPIPADYGTKLDAADKKAADLMVRLGSYMDRNDGQMCNIADSDEGNPFQKNKKGGILELHDSDTEAEKHGIEIGGKREMVR